MRLSISLIQLISNEFQRNDFGFDFELENGFEVLELQVASLISTFDNENFRISLIDDDGRLIENDEDIEYIFSLHKLNHINAFIHKKQDIFLQYCSSYFLNESESLQQSFCFADSSYILCKSCSTNIDSSLMTIPTITSPFCCQAESLSTLGLLPYLENKFTSRLHFPLPLFLNFKRMYFLKFISQDRSSYFKNDQVIKNQFTQRFTSPLKIIEVYEDPHQQTIAIEHIDYKKIWQYLIEELENALMDQSDKCLEEMIIRALMKWFKRDFFKWCNSPPCEFCDKGTQYMKHFSQEPPNSIEKSEGWAGRVEIYQCQACSNRTRFPRYNNPGYMIKNSRRGRCGEFANVFGLILRSVGFDVRYVLDLTDHVWNEVWIEALQRFVHIDVCERAFDSPLMYEKGWKKKLTYVVSYGRYGVSDALPRYSCNQENIISQRAKESGLSASQFFDLISEIDASVKSNFLNILISQKSRPNYNLHWYRQFLDFVKQGSMAFAEINHSYFDETFLNKRRRYNKKELEGYFLLPERKTQNPEEAQGRISGDIQWRLQRGEICSSSAIEMDSKDQNQNVPPNIKSSVIETTVESLLFISNEVNNYISYIESNDLNLSTSRIQGLSIFYGNSKKITLQLQLTTFPNDQISPRNEDLFKIARIGNLNLAMKKEYCNIMFISSNSSLFRYELSLLSPDFDKSKISEPSGFWIIYYHSYKFQWNSHPMMRQILANFNIELDDPFETDDKEVWLIINKQDNLIDFKLFSKSSFQTSRDKSIYIWPLINKKDGPKPFFPISISLDIVPSLNPIKQNHTLVMKESTLCSQPNFFQAFPFDPTKPSNGKDEVIAHASNKVLSDSYLTGYSIVSNFIKSCFMVYYFSAKGLPLRRSNESISFVKVQSDLNALHCDKQGFPLQNIGINYYFFMGGGFHPDTVYFNSIASEASFTDLQPISFLSLHAGKSLVNGLSGDQLYGRFYSTSFDDNPETISFDIKSDGLEKVIIRSGSLIDRIELRLNSGKEITVGGTGGEEISFNFLNWLQYTDKLIRPIGFFGGTGGHLHNLGLIFREDILFIDKQPFFEFLYSLYEPIFRQKEKWSFFFKNVCFIISSSYFLLIYWFFIILEL